MKIVRLDEVDSTNLYAKSLIGEEEELAVIALRQTGGRGTKGRQFVSEAGGVYLTRLNFPVNFPASQAFSIMASASVAVCKTVEKFGLSAGIKWPNDVVINGKKICGILTEMYQSAAGSFFLVIGTGINVNQKEFPEEVKKTASSLALELGADVDREVLLASVLRHFSDCYDSFLETMDLSGQKELYESFLVNKGRVVEVLDPKGEWQGTAIGIEKTGELLVQREDGSVEAVYAGEVSVRGIYGYV